MSDDILVYLNVEVSKINKRLTLYSDKQREGVGFSNLNHIVRNVLNILSCHAEFIENGLTDIIKSRSDYENHVLLVNSYLDLVKARPEFLDKELNEQDGFFPEVSKIDSLIYIQHALDYFKLL